MKKVYALFEVYYDPEDNVAFELIGLFANKSAAKAYISDHPIITFYESRVELPLFDDGEGRVEFVVEPIEIQS